MREGRRRPIWGLVVVLASLVGAAGLLFLAPAWAPLCAPGDRVCDFLTRVAPIALLNLRMALTAIAVGVLFGFFLGVGRISRFAPLRAVSRGYTELIRGTPLLIQIFVVFFSFPALNLLFAEQGIAFRFVLSDVERIIIALTLNTAAYQAEIFRAGFQSIALGQIEAAVSIGMSKSQAMAHVILPQSLRIMAPPFTNEYIIMFKDATPLALFLGVNELLRASRAFGAGFGDPMQGILMATGIFLLFSLLLTLFLRLLERRFAVPGMGIRVRPAE